MAHPDTSPESPRDAIDREVDALLDVVLPGATAGELAVLRHVLERTLEARAARQQEPMEPSLSEVLAGAERASERVAAWPVWKRRVA